MSEVPVDQQERQVNASKEETETLERTGSLVISRILRRVYLNQVQVLIDQSENHVKTEKKVTNREEKENEDRERPLRRVYQVGKLSRQEMLYKNILQAEVNLEARKQQRQKSNRQFMMIREEERKKEKKERRLINKDSPDWERRFRNWSPEQQWHITENWTRNEVKEQTEARNNNRETYKYLKF